MREINLYLVRHGESEQNAHQEQPKSEFPYCSLNPLTEVGREQATRTGIALRRHFQGVPAFLIPMFASPHLRTMQTAEIIREEINKGRSSENKITFLFADKRLLEQRWGMLEPYYHQDFPIAKKLYDAYKGLWNDAASHMNGPLLPIDLGNDEDEVRRIAQEVGLQESEIRGESGRDVIKRLNSFLTAHQEELITAGMNMIIVTSRAPILMSRVALGIEQPDNLASRIRKREIVVPNASVTRYTRDLEPR